MPSNGTHSMPRGIVCDINVKSCQKECYSYMYMPPTAITATQRVATSSHPIASYNRESYAVSAWAWTDGRGDDGGSDGGSLV